MQSERQPTLLKMRWMLFLLGFFKIRLIGYVRPRLDVLDDNQVCITINLRRRSKNHLNSMYFGAMAVGADLAGAIHGFYFSEKYGVKSSIAFKEMNAKFLKRADSDTRFICKDGALLEQALLQSKETGERLNQQVKVLAYNTSDEVVAEFELITSIKVIPSK